MRLAHILSLALVVSCGKGLAVPLGNAGQGRLEMTIAVEGHCGQLGEKWIRSEDEAGYPWKRDEDESEDALKRPGNAWKRDEDEPEDALKRPGNAWKRDEDELADK